MSEMRIKDGQTGNIAGVSDVRRLLVDSVSISDQTWHSQRGDGYNLNTGIIALSSASSSAVAYLKYTGSKKLNISTLVVGVGNWAGTPTDPGLISMIRNPTGGTIINNALTAGTKNQNRDFSSANVLSSTFYKGAEGYTLTGGDDIAIFYQGDNGRLSAPIDFILGPQNSVGITIQPNDATAGNIYVAFICYEADTL